jgi:hypothetical protein
VNNIILANRSLKSEQLKLCSCGGTNRYCDKYGHVPSSSNNTTATSVGRDSALTGVTHEILSSLVNGLILDNTT